MKPPKRSFWLRQIQQWHWISAAISLVGMLAFAITGITLNHATAIPAEPKIVTIKGAVPGRLLSNVSEAGVDAPVPKELRAWLADTLSVHPGVRPAEWSPNEIYVPMPRPGGDAWLSINRNSGEILYESTSRGWVSYFNDLHKGRNTGAAWSWFIDIFAAACVMFCVTGLLLLQFHAWRRPSTWPLVGAGLAAPLLLILIFIH